MILIVQPKGSNALYVDIGDLDPEEVAEALFAIGFDGHLVGLVEARRWFSPDVTDLTALFDIFDDYAKHLRLIPHKGRGGKLSLRKIRQLSPRLRSAVLRDWATFLHNLSWESLREELATIEEVLQDDMRIAL